MSDIEQGARKGVIIEESLEDASVLQRLNIISSETVQIDASATWRLHTVVVSENEIRQLVSHIKAGWYIHFWRGREVIAVFKDKIFTFDFDDKTSWQPAIDHGLSLDIPLEQLDFPID